MGLLDHIRRVRPQPAGPSGRPLPDPAKPPGNRGDWDSAALTNVDITELVKDQIRNTARPWQK
ncbi:MAG: hypothetical protein ACRENL_04375 [Candidatus Dormibacteria bacterium]